MARRAAEENTDDQYVDEEPLPEGPQEPETMTDLIVHHTPWWFISAFIHAIGFALMALAISVDTSKKEEEVVVVAPPRTPPPEPEIEKPKDLEQQEKFLDIPQKADEVVFKRAEVSEVNESDDQEDFKSMKGESTDFKSDKPFKGKGINSSIGGGGGGGGRYGTRFGGRKNAVAAGGGNDATEAAVTQALKWLARHQSADGSWSMKGYVRRCGAVKKYGGDCTPDGLKGDAAGGSPQHNFDVGLTSLSMLAFLGAGYTHTSKETYDGINFGDVVRNGLQYLLRVQDGDGCVGSREINHYMYNHTIAALCLSEAYGLTGSNKFKEQAQKAIDFIVASQNPGKGWRYIYQAGESDSSVTGWAVMALKSADLSGLDFPKDDAYNGARAWFDFVSYKAEGAGTGTSWKAGYQEPVEADVVIPGINDSYAQHPAMTAIAVMCRIFMDKKRGDPKNAGGAAVLLADVPKWETSALDFYYWYYASLALYQYDGPDGPAWKKWNKEMVSALVGNQNKEADKDRNGSWEPIDRWACEGGRIYSTAINCLTLEVYYRYASVFGGKSN